MPDDYATKQDLKELKDELKQELHQAINDAVSHLAAAMHAGFAEQEERTKQMIVDAETRFLQQFYSYARGQERRVHSWESTQQDDRARLAALESRVLELEARMSGLPPMPPPGR